MNPFSAHLGPLVLTAAGLAGLLAFACSSPGEMKEEELLGTVDDAVTAKGTAVEGGTCLASPTLRKDKCAPGLSCAKVGAATSGVCVGRHNEADTCNPAHGNVGCVAGLVCTPLAAGGGFCKGTGVGPCKVAHGSAGCAADRTCVEDVPGSGKGSCKTNGTEGSACNDELIDNECGAGFECVVPPGGSPGVGVCTNPDAGGIGAPCGDLLPDDGKCAAGYTCAMAPSKVGTRLDPQAVGYRCAMKSGRGGYCMGVFYASYARLHGTTTCGTRPCYPYVTTHQDGQYATGLCDDAVGVVGGYCGGLGVENCGLEPGGARPLGCINHQCAALGGGLGHACTLGTSPSGANVSTCGSTWPSGRQLQCVNGTCS